MKNITHYMLKLRNLLAASPINLLNVLVFNEQIPLQIHIKHIKHIKNGSEI